jgi:hypothetical protein
VNGGSIPSGLCDRCRHASRIESRRGSVFLRCRLADGDAEIPRYPRLPVLECGGFEPVRGAPANEER